MERHDAQTPETGPYTMCGLHCAKTQLALRPCCSLRVFISCIDTAEYTIDKEGPDIYAHAQAVWVFTVRIKHMAQGLFSHVE